MRKRKALSKGAGNTIKEVIVGFTLAAIVAIACYVVLCPQMKCNFPIEKVCAKYGGAQVGYPQHPLVDPSLLSEYCKNAREED